MRDLIRQIVGGYKSLKLEGQDEGYVLFRGEEADTRQPVLIKILPRLLGDDPQIAAEFRKLSQAIRALNHPNIAAAQTVGEQAGLPYVVTRAIERAQPLAERLDQPWAVDAAADVVMQIGQALEHAYNKGVVHGALTPDNVLVRPDGRVTVTDFGLSELLDMVGAQVKEEASPFLAPERQAGAQADPRADVYSLASLLYSLLTKRTPQVVKGEVLPPSRFNPDVPAEMDQVIVKALAPRPADRYPDVKSFLAAFGAVSLVPAAETARPEADDDRCPRCGTPNQTDRFCRNCGQGLERGESQGAVPSRSRRLRAEPSPSSRTRPEPLRDRAIEPLRRTREVVAPPPPAEAMLDEPIQITRIDVGQIEIGRGIDVQPTTIAQPMMVASGEIRGDFPEPLAMPQVDLRDLWPEASDEPMIAMPEPPAMPDIDWAEVAPPMPEVPVIEDIYVEED